MSSSCSSGSAWMRAVVASLRGPQRRLSWRRVTVAASAAPLQKVLGGLGVEQLVGGNACDHHDFFLTMK
ncbi:MAG: hypothetical protein VKI42_01395 [Synechococcaceae cyanobacterium]|nr:hypothetical protein [Synechococcaceae cyanobacterium]